MTKYQVMSDLHIEHHRDEGKSFIASLPVCADTLILAGDVCAYPQIEDVLNMFGKKWKQTIYITGNHEHYGSSLTNIESMRYRLSFELPSNVHWLEQGNAAIQSAPLIHGATLWFNDYPNAPRTLSDFDLINQFEPQVYDTHRKTVDYLQNNVKEGDIVVTHHSPSYQSMSERYKSYDGNCWFHNNLDSLILDKKPALYLHGHTHDSKNYMLGDTRIVANPFGYFEHDENPDFKEDLVIEI